MLRRPEVLVVGTGIGGLTLARKTQARGLGCRIAEAAPTLEPLGSASVGINVLPHASRELAALGLRDEPTAAGVLTATASMPSERSLRRWSRPPGALKD
jgi:2-polyprenyl-6-methoxyphenol hydroxylase-like FAD-dependent oxidoreductase